jgi:uncharacterized protein (TIGR03083 family)
MVGAKLMNPVEPIILTDRFAELQAELLTVLWSLEPDDWYKPTVCAPWTVKDLAAHILDTQIRRLSRHRDNIPNIEYNKPLEGFNGILAYINDTNAIWVQAATRISPPLLVNFLAITGDEVSQFLSSLDPFAKAQTSVAWAGESESQQWFDTAREYTEWWMHQQQLRDAVGQPLLTGYRSAQPALDTFMRAMPYTYRDVDALDSTSIWVCITGEAGGDWTLVREEGKWQLYSGALANPTARVQMEQDVAWRVFTKGMDFDTARKRVQITGDQALGEVVLNMVSIMA